MGAFFVKSAMGVVSCLVEGGGAGVSMATSPIVDGLSIVTRGKRLEGEPGI